MLDEDSTMDVEGEPTPPEGESNNRTFLIVGGILAAIVLLTLICMAVYVVVTLPNRQAQRAAEQTAIATQNLGLSMQMTATADAALWTPTLPSPTPPPATPSPTPVVAMPSESPTPDMLPLTQTMAYLRTQVEISRLTPTGTLGLPRSGFADEVGLPGLFIAATALVVVILLARRLRSVPVKK